MLIAPTGKTQKVVVYTHGSGQRVENIFRDPKKEPVSKTLLGAGYAIAASCVSAASAMVGVTTTTGDHSDPSNYEAPGVLRLFESVDE